MKVGKVLAIVRPQFSAGFLLAGADVYEVEDSRKAERKIKEILNDPKEYFLVVVDEYLVRDISNPTLSTMFSSTEPVFVNVGLTGKSDEETIRGIQQLAREALGYTIKIDA